MAIKRFCDKCGKEAIGAIHVDVYAEGVAHPERPTGVRLSRDSCEKCRPTQMKEMLGEASKQLETDIPRHRTMIEARAEEEAALAEQSQVNRQMADAKAAGLAPRAEHAQRAQELDTTITQARARYHEAFQGKPVAEG